MKSIKQDSNSTKERILEAAKKVFSKGSFYDAKMRDIAREAGMSQGNIYQHYASKESLLFQIVDGETVKLIDGLRSQLAGIRGTENKIRKMTYYLLHFRQNDKQLTWMENITVSFKSWSDIKDTWPNAMEGSYIFREILREGKKNGEVRQDVNIRVVGHLYFSGLRSISTFWLWGKQFTSLDDELAENVVDIIWQAVRTPPLYSQCPYVKVDKVVNKSDGNKQQRVITEERVVLGKK